MRERLITKPSSQPEADRTPYDWVKRFAIVALILIIIAVLGGFYLGQSLRPYQYQATFIDPPISVPDVTMVSAETLEEVNLSDFRGKFVMIYFGYTGCPDVCPTTLSNYSQAYDMLDKATRERLQFVWITVDPERDTPEALVDYINHFRPQFMTAVIPRSDAELSATAKSLGAHYAKVERGSESGYLMDHTASVMLVDPNGDWRMVIPFSMSPEAIAQDLTELVKTY